eukprot:765407-Hanusia_phi.AAC.4
MASPACCTQRLLKSQTQTSQGLPVYLHEVTQASDLHVPLLFPFDDLRPVVREEAADDVGREVAPGQLRHGEERAVEASNLLQGGREVLLEAADLPLEGCERVTRRGMGGGESRSEEEGEDEGEEEGEEGEGKGLPDSGSTGAWHSRHCGSTPPLSLNRLFGNCDWLMGSGWGLA